MTTLLLAGDKPGKGRAARRGLTLIEVILAMAIFLLSLGAIVPLIKMGLDRALEIQLQATALQKCQSKLAEVIAGWEPISAQNDASFPDNVDEDWRWTLDMAQNDITGVWTVNVRVYLQYDGGRVEVALSQIIMEPTMRGGPPAVPPADPNATDPNAAGGTTGGG